MGKNSKSQWDFGELFDPATTRRVFTVTELTAKVRKVLEKELGQVWVTGEVTNLRLQSSGHIYFTIKDGNAQLQCVLFRGEPVANRQVLQDGQKVVLQGDLTVYEARGQYQLRVLADQDVHGLPPGLHVRAAELDLVIIYAGHYATETLGVAALAEHTAGAFGLEWTMIHAPTGL